MTRTTWPRQRALSGSDRVILGLACVVTGAAALVSLPASSATQGQPLAIVFPPWISGQEAVARSLDAGHLVLRQGRSAFVVIVAPTAAPIAKPQSAIAILPLAGLAGCLDITAAEGNPT